MFRLNFILGYVSLQLLLRAEAQQDYKCVNAVRTELCPHPDIKFWHYTMDTPFGVLMQPGRPPSRYFSTPRPLKVLIHSYTGNLQTSPNCHIRAPLLRIPGLNIISVDYSNLVPNLCYKEAVHNAHLVGRCLAQFLMSFVRKRMVRPQDIHLIGFGLGAHVAGFAAKFMRSFRIHVGHITGLDPAKPHFQTMEKSERLDASDADFVDIIHTDVLVHGLMMPIGHVDFYPNHGMQQPMCGELHQVKTHLCFHHRAAEYYAESIFSNIGFLGFPCKDLEDYVCKRCMPSGDLQVMGYKVRPSVRGSYFLKTNSFAPYAVGPRFENMDHSILGIEFKGRELREKLHELRLTDVTLETYVYIDVMPVNCSGAFPFCI